MSGRSNNNRTRSSGRPRKMNGKMKSITLQSDSQIQVQQAHQTKKQAATHFRLATSSKGRRVQECIDRHVKDRIDDSIPTSTQDAADANDRVLSGDSQDHNNFDFTPLRTDPHVQKKRNAVIVPMIRIFSTTELFV